MQSLLYYLKKNTLLFLLFFAGLVLIPFTGNVHLFDWDEINFAECAREMIVSNSYHTVLLNYQPFWEKPPLFIWLQVLSMKIFGVNEFSARFPNIINGLLTLCLLYYLGKKWYSKTFGILWATLHLASILPHLYFRSGIIDPWYNLFGLIALISGIESIKTLEWKWSCIGGIALGLAVLTKGPAMVLIVTLTLLLVIVFQKIILTTKHWMNLITAIMVFLLTGSSWFLYEYFIGNTEIIKAFIDYQIRLFKTEDSGHSGFLLYHFIVVFLGCFPASVFALRYFSKTIQKDIYSFALMSLLFVVLIIFSMVKTKIVHYSSMSYYTVSFLATYVLNKDTAILKWQKILLLIMGIIIGIILITVGSIEHWKNWIIPILEKSDRFATENLKTSVVWYGYEFLCGVVLIAVILWFIFQKQYNFSTILKFFVIQILWISMTINSYVGKIEQYTQASAIHFFQYCADKDIIVDTYGYKSYAYLFYGKRMPFNNIEQNKVNKYWNDLTNAGYEKLFSYNLACLNYLIYDDEKYPVCLVSKIQDEENVLKTGRFKKLYAKGGYVFFMKIKKLP
ncbi:MAG: hypothetical protein KatS3mg027_0507 [Bacteroidia bacterium]|nr:MAG: hypothetical protein KatS3mg027_0507 [Bacteroidia bacterium]